MSVTPSRVRRFSSAIGDDAVRFGDRILIAPALGKEAGSSMSAYTSFLYAGARADLPASTRRSGWCSAERYEWAPRATP